MRIDPCFNSTTIRPTTNLATPVGDYIYYTKCIITCTLQFEFGISNLHSVQFSYSIHLTLFKFVSKYLIIQTYIFPTNYNIIIIDIPSLYLTTIMSWNRRYKISKRPLIFHFHNYLFGNL